MSLLKKYQQGDRGPDLIDKLAYKSEIKNNDSLSIELYNLILNNQSEYGQNVIERAEFYIAKLALKTDDLSKMNDFIAYYSNSDRIRDAYRQLSSYYKNKKDTLSEIGIIKRTVLIFPDNPSVLNSYAWRLSELNIDLEDALDKIDKALTLTDKNNSSYPNLLDTKAELLFRMDFFDEAIKIIDEAISIDNKSQYYKDQKNKFKKSK